MLRIVVWIIMIWGGSAFGYYIDSLMFENVPDEVFISHPHFDHAGGLSAFLDKNNNVRIYVPISLKGIHNAKEIIYVDDPIELYENIFKATSQFGKVHAIIGGLHGFNEFEVFKDLEVICPIHCTQHGKVNGNAVIQIAKDEAT